jgi:hypothetical protein
MSGLLCRQTRERKETDATIQAIEGPFSMEKKRKKKSKAKGPEGKFELVSLHG